MTIAELEKKSGFQRSTIHHYIRCGLLQEPYRTSQTMAYYDESHLQRLDAIRRIKQGFLKTATTSRVPLEFIKDRIDGECEPIPTQPQVQRRPERKSTEMRSKKRKEIIETALSVYSKKGYYRTNIRDITKKVGISAPTFYHYFPDKRELFIEVINHVINDWKEQSSAAVRNEPDSTMRSIILFRKFQEHYPRIGEILNHLRAGNVVGDRWARDRLSQVYRDLMKNITESTRRSMERGALRSMDPELLSYFLFMIDEAVLQRATVDNKYTIEELMSFIADIYAFGIMTDKGRENLSKFRRKVRNVKKGTEAAST